MADGYQKSFVIGASTFVPAFTVDPENGLAALDVQFEDTSFNGGFTIQKEFVAEVGEEPVQKVFV